TSRTEEEGRPGAADTRLRRIGPDAAYAVKSLAVYVACALVRPDDAVAPGHRLSGACQGRPGARALLLQMGYGRSFGRGGCTGLSSGLPCRPVDAGRRLQSDAGDPARVQPAPRCAVRACRAVCGAPARLPHLRAHAQSVAALSPGAQDGRP